MSVSSSLELYPRFWACKSGQCLWHVPEVAAAVTASGTDRIQIFLKLAGTAKRTTQRTTVPHSLSSPNTSILLLRIWSPGPGNTRSLTMMVPKPQPGRKSAPTQASLVYSPCLRPRCPVWQCACSAVTVHCAVLSCCWPSCCHRSSAKVAAHVVC